MKTDILPKKYIKIWEASLPFLKEGRPGDDLHALEVAKLILEYSGKLKLNLDVLVPVAIMHDIGHSAILPEHFKFITGGEKLVNGKLVHMLVGAKMAKTILESVDYDKNHTQEIIDIISMHDSDQLKGVNMEEVYSTQEKKIFHDVDSLDRFTEERFNSFIGLFPNKSKQDIIQLLETMSKFFFEEFEEIAKKRLKELKKKLKI